MIFYGEEGEDYPSDVTNAGGDIPKSFDVKETPFYHIIKFVQNNSNSQVKNHSRT